MFDKQLLDLERQRSSAYQRLSQLNIKYRTSFKEYEQLGEYASSDLQDQISRIESNIDFIRKRMVEVNKTCSEKVAQKKQHLENIRQFEQKRNKLGSILLEEGGKLKELKKGSLNLQEKIKKQRDQYQELQQEIYDLDDRVENLKMFGVQEIPQQMLVLIKKKEAIIVQIEQKQRQIEKENIIIGKMVKKEEIDHIQTEIKELRMKKQQINILQEQNKQLRVTNEQLNKVKSQYEWNPNLQIKILQNSMQEQENKISLIEKEINLLSKKSSECSLKIQEYNNYVRKRQKEGLDDLGVDQFGKKEKTRRENRHTIFEQIKKQLETEVVSKNQSIFSKLRMKMKGQEYKQQQKMQNCLSQIRNEDGPTYLLKKKINLIQFWIVVIVLSALSYYCHRTYRK